MPRVSHLIRRNGVYSFKIDLPDDLAGKPLPPSIPDAIKPLESPIRRSHLKTAVWLSLRTTAERVAKQRVGLQIAAHANLFDATTAFLINGITPSQTEPSRGCGEAPAIPQGLVEQSLTITKAFQSWSVGDGVKGTKKPAPNTVTEGNAALRRFVELFGDMPVQHIGKGHGREYRDAIAKLPKGLPIDLKRLSIKALLQCDLTAYEPRSATTINKSLTLLGAVLAHAEQDGHFDGTEWRNPFDVGFEIDPADEDYYEPFSKDELNTLMASPVFTAGERPKRGRGETAKWAPLRRSLNLRP